MFFVYVGHLERCRFRSFESALEYANYFVSRNYFDVSIYETAKEGYVLHLIWLDGLKVSDHA